MTQSPIRLVPLLCVKCRAPIQAQVDEIAWVCEQCGQGQRLESSGKQGATCALDVFFSQAIQQGQKGRPFWVSRGQVTITQRITYQGNEERAAANYWAKPRLFFVPAWETSLDEVIRTGIVLLNSPVRMDIGSPGPFLPVVTPIEDIRSLAEFMVMSIEADRRDALKTVDFSLSLEPAQLWILP